MTSMDIAMKLTIVLAIIGLVSSQQFSILGLVSRSFGNIAFALSSSKSISETLEYAHFLPLTKNNKLHQVKVIVDYTPIGLGKYAYMKVYGQNKTLLKISSSPHGVDTIAPGKARFATTISDGTIKQV